MSGIIDPRERERAHADNGHVDFYAEAIKASERFRKDYDGRLNLVKAHQMPFERSPDGLIKHIINEKMDTKECCLDIYMQFLPPGKASGKHRHLSEEVVYVIEGKGYDLHWDVRFDVHDTMEFEWVTEPKRYDWEQGDFVYIPPYCGHQHFNADPDKEARFIVINSRVIKPMGFDWFEQLENAEGY
jgi:gentisate 1,2-dioxygenase